MKKINLSTIVTSLLISGLMVAGVSAANVKADPGDLYTIDSNPGIYFDDTDYSGSYFDWYMGGWSTKFWIFSREHGEVLSIPYSANAANSLIINSSGDINLADGSVFIDRSANRMGIGTVVPSHELHLSSSNPTIQLTDTDGVHWFLNLYGGSNMFDISHQPTVGGVIHSPFKVEGAPSNSLVIEASGEIGIGTSDPAELVDVRKEGGASRFQLTSVSTSGVNVAQFVQRRARDGETAVKNNDNLGQFSFRGHNGTTYTGTRAGIAVLAAQNWSHNAEGTRMIFTVTQKGTNTPQHGLRIEDDGDVYVPNGNLYVGGTKLNVPDYVFEKEYDLMPLSDLRTFIDKNNHLPGITSAKDVKKEGFVDMTQMQMNLLEKVEELTLYTLNQEEAIASRDIKLKEMESKIAKLESFQQRLVKLELLLVNLASDTKCIKTEKLTLKQ